jgi:hypothetical protein
MFIVAQLHCTAIIQPAGDFVNRLWLNVAVAQWVRISILAEDFRAVFGAGLWRKCLPADLAIDKQTYVRYNTVHWRCAHGAGRLQSGSSSRRRERAARRAVRAELRAGAASNARRAGMAGGMAFGEARWQAWLEARRLA